MRVVHCWPVVLAVSGWAQGAVLPSPVARRAPHGTVSSHGSASSSPAPGGPATISSSFQSSAFPSTAAPSGWAQTVSPGSAFPVSDYSSFYQAPCGTTVEPRPAIVNSVPLRQDAPHFLPDAGNPSALPTTAPSASADMLPEASPATSPPTPSGTALAMKSIESAIAKLAQTNTTSKEETCALCKRGLALGQEFAHSYPDAVPQVLGGLCSRFQAPSYVGKTYATLAEAQNACYLNYNASVLGGAYASVLSYADLTPSSTSTRDDDQQGASDAELICYKQLKLCPRPAPLNLTSSWIDAWFAKSNTLSSPAADVVQQHEQYSSRRDALRAKQTTKLAPLEPVAHLSDIHLDPRFQPGAEARCTSGQCCRTDSWNKTLATGPPMLLPEGILPAKNVSEAAKYWGNYACDSPWSLVASTFEAIHQVLPQGKKLALSLFTGDMVTHEGAANWHLTRDLLLYVQQGLVDLMDRYLGPGPTMLTLGNHDTVPDDFAPVGSLPDHRGEQLQWEWDHIADLIKSKGWLKNPEELESVRRHSSGFSALVHPGNKSSEGSNLELDVPPLRVISLNADMWYQSNVFTLIGSQNPDRSGMLRWVTNELVHAEKRGEKVWVMGHVLPAWAGGDAWPNPTQVFHILVDRFAPTTLTHIFFGHTHEDQFTMFYPFHPAESAQEITYAPATGKNGSSFPVDTARYAKAAGFMAPSVTPGHHLNPEFRIYTVDPHGWVVTDYQQYAARLQDVTYSDQSPDPVWQLLYSARETYGHFPSLVEKGAYAGPVQLQGKKGCTWPAHVPLNGSFWAAVTDEMVLRPSMISLHTTLSSGNSSTALQCTEGECLAAKVCYLRAGDARQGSECLQGYNSVQG